VTTVKPADDENARPVLPYADAGAGRFDDGITASQAVGAVVEWAFVAVAIGWVILMIARA